MYAFPGRIKTQTGAVIESPGMDLRDWFAGMWLMGAAGSLDRDTLAILAYQCADAMMRHRDMPSCEHEWAPIKVDTPEGEKAGRTCTKCWEAELE